MKRALALALLVGCARSVPAHAPSNVGGSRTFAPPALYAALFELGHTWRYAVAEEGQAARIAQCQVTGVVALDGGVASRIACDGLADADTGDPDPLTGVWLASADGLYFLSTGPLPAAGPVPPLVDDYRVLPAAPVDVVVARPRTGDDGADTELTVRRDGDAWCSTVEVTHGSEAYTERCFAASGVVRGRWGYGRYGSNSTFVRK